MILNPEQKLECLRLAKELRPLGHTSAEQLVKDAATSESFVAGRTDPLKEQRERQGALSWLRNNGLLWQEDH